ncbi:MAG: hypothetical protein AB8H47_21020 [Bacteroidia bacterium]
MNPQLQTLRHFFLLILFCCSTYMLSAQPPFNQQYPTLTLVNANENPNNAIYKISKAGTLYRISIGINGNNAGFVIQTQADGVIGQATAALNGTCKTIAITNTRRGLLDLWQFAMDRVGVANGALLMRSAQPGGSNNGKVEMQCEEKCDEKLEQGIAADNAAKGAAFYAIISVGNGTCDGYIPCTQELLQEYEDCVCACIQDSKK